MAMKVWDQLRHEIPDNWPIALGHRDGGL